jgi:hypothetical protein
MRYQFILTLILSCFISCNNNRQETKHEESPLVAKDKPTDSQKALIAETDSIDIENASVKADEYYYDGDSAAWVGKNLLGCWFEPHNGGVDIKLMDNGQFEFNDYNDGIGKHESLKGKFSLQHEVLILFYDDRPKQKFSFTMGGGSDDNYYIKNAAGYYFVKGTCD